MAKQNLQKMLSRSAERSTPVEIRRGKGVGLSVDEQIVQDTDEPRVVWVVIDHLLDNPYQHAEDIDQNEYEALVESIKIDGFQGALNVSPVPEREEYYFLTSGGHQRRNAARDAGLKKLPVFVGATPAEQKQLGLRLARENTAQVNRSPVNLGFLYSQLIEEFGMTQEEIAAEIKKDRYHVNFAIMAARSATDIRAALREKYSPRVMTYLRRLEDEEDRAPIIARYLANDLTVEGVRVAVEKAQEKKKQGETGSATSIPVEEYSSHEQTQKVETHGVSEGEKQEQRETLLQGVKDSLRSSGTDTGEELVKRSGGSVDTSERVSKAQAAFSRIETYRRYIEKKRADGEVIALSKQEATLLGKIIDRCHTLLDSYGEDTQNS